MRDDLSPRLIDLALEPAFALAGLEVRPASLEVLAGERREQLEPRIMQVLVVLAGRRGEVVSRDELVQRCWGGRVVGDDSINRCIFQLRKLAESLGGFEIVTVPRVGFRLSETTGGARPGGLAQRRRMLLAGLAAAATLVLAGFGIWLSRSAAPHESAVTPRIAVRAFDVIGGDPQTKAISARLSDAVAGVLNENGIAVAPPGSAADAADLVVGGTVSQQGDLVQVRAYLTDPRSHFTLWSAQFERSVAAEAPLRDAVAVAASDAVNSALETFQQPGLRLDPQTLALVIRGMLATQSPDPLAPGKALRAFEEVVARAPNFGEGHALLAFNLTSSVAQATGNLTSSVAQATGAARTAALARLRTEANAAIRLSPATSGAAFDALYYVSRRESPGDIVKAEDILLAGLRTAPDFPFLPMRECQFLTGVGRLEEALHHCERAIALRPLAAAIGYRYAHALSYVGRPDLAEQAVAKTFRFHPKHGGTRRWRFELSALYGSPETVLTILHDPEQRPLELEDPQTKALEAFLHARQTNASADQVRALHLLRNQNLRYFVMGGVLFGRLDDAFAGLADPRLDSETIGELLFEPIMAPLRRDPRFWPVATRTGLVAYWRTRGIWPDFCRDPNQPIDCEREAARALVAAR